MMNSGHRIAIAALGAVLLSACAQGPNRGYPYFKENLGLVPQTPPAVIRQPVVPEMLVQCRGHVLVPALGMTFVNRGTDPPAAGQFLREENLTPPYRILPPRAIVTKEHSPARLNVELDDRHRIIGLYCG
ncbi:MAG: I78 family peptidase inhibitor [Rhodospirillaceae bacterium]